MNRRGVLRFAAVGLAVPLLRRSRAAAAPHGDPVQQRMTVIYDERYRDARAFALHLGHHGAVAWRTRGDATGLWYGAPASLLRQSNGAVAGLTTHSDLVIARSCGRELGLRLVFERRYASLLDRTFVAGQDFARHHADAVGLLAEALTRSVAGDYVAGDYVAGDYGAIETDGPVATDRSGHLVAWLLMPRTPPATA